ncbi:MAG: hypothetical protein R3F49_06990 [Planctomycetota bacterium]
MNRLSTRLLCVLALSGPGFAQTTTLDFAGLSQTQDLDRGYGDRVAGPSSGGHNYSGTGTFTPNVSVDFGVWESGSNYRAVPWTTGYNGLVDVIYGSPYGWVAGGAELRVTLTADPGARVSFRSCDLGNYGAAMTLPYVRVTDEQGAVLFEERDVALPASSAPSARRIAPTPAPTGRILTLRVSLEGLGSFASWAALDNLTFGQTAAPTHELGSAYCGPAVVNSSAGAAAVRLWGSDAVAANDVRVLATGLPFASFGFFLTSRTQGQVAQPGGSQGVLCLAGSIGRFVGPGQIVNSGVGGSFELPLDLAALPTPTGPVSAVVGETWNFTAWYRDANPTPTSNFTDAVEVTWR